MTSQFSWWYADDVLRIKNTQDQELISVHQDFASEIYCLLEAAKEAGESAVSLVVAGIWLGAKARDIGRCAVVGSAETPTWRKS